MSKNRVLVYAGAHLGGSLSQHLRNFDLIFAFEANPLFCEQLKSKFTKHKNLNVINAALCKTHGEKVEFNISSNNGDSSSLLSPNKQNCLYEAIKPCMKISVDGLNLRMFLEERGIEKINTYISDLQGYDYEVLKTLKPLIDAGSIETIECEVSKTNKTSIYEYGGIEPNTDENFDSLLSHRYERVATGWGNLLDGVFANVPDDWCEWDVRWKLKTA